MKILAMILCLTALSPRAFACPDFTGRYTVANLPVPPSSFVFDHEASTAAVLFNLLYRDEPISTVTLTQSGCQTLGVMLAPDASPQPDTLLAFTGGHWGKHSFHGVKVRLAGHGAWPLMSEEDLLVNSWSIALDGEGNLQLQAVTREIGVPEFLFIPVPYHEREVFKFTLARDPSNR
jgi:hypothetical protein